METKHAIELLKEELAKRKLAVRFESEFKEKIKLEIKSIELAIEKLSYTPPSATNTLSAEEIEKIIGASIVNHFDPNLGAITFQRIVPEAAKQLLSVFETRKDQEVKKAKEAHKTQVYNIIEETQKQLASKEKEVAELKAELENITKQKDGLYNELYELKNK